MLMLFPLTVAWRRMALSLAAIIVALLAVAPTIADAQPRKMFWGPVSVDGVSQFPTYEDLGVDVFQIQLRWNAVAPTQPTNPADPTDPAYQWPSDVDQAVREAADHGMDVAIMLWGSPLWANGDRDPHWAPTDPADFADFARAAASRYASVRTWMIWGEPSFVEKFQPSTGQRSFSARRLTKPQQRGPRTYARLLDAAYGALKDTNRRNLVVGGMTAVTGSIRPANWVRYMRLPSGRPPRMDLYGHNAFGARRPDLRNPPSPEGAVDLSDAGRFQKVVNRHLARPRGKRRIPLYLSEYTVPTGPDSEFNFYTTPAVQASWIRSAFSVARKLDAWGLGWIHLRDGERGSSTRGGLLTASGERKPGYAAFKRAP